LCSSARFAARRFSCLLVFVSQLSSVAGFGLWLLALGYTAIASGDCTRSEASAAGRIEPGKAAARHFGKLRQMKRPWVAIRPRVLLQFHLEGERNTSLKAMVRVPSWLGKQWAHRQDELGQHLPAGTAGGLGIPFRLATATAPIRISGPNWETARTNAARSAQMVSPKLTFSTLVRSRFPRWSAAALRPHGIWNKANTSSARPAPRA